MPAKDPSLCLLFVSLACQVGPDPWVELDPAATTSAEPTDLRVDDASTSGPEATWGADAACDPLSHVCRPEPPAGWLGPVARRVGEGDETPPECGGAYPHPVDLPLFADLVGTEHACGCACGEATGAECVGAALMKIGPAEGSCDDAPGVAVTSVVPYTGAGLATGIVGVGARPLESSVLGGSCDVIDTSRFGTPGFETAATLCRPSPSPDPVVCDDDTSCLPHPDVPFSPGLCIFRAGDVPCPEGGPYLDRELYHQGWHDDRACACDCEPPTGTCEGASLTLAYWLFEYLDEATIPVDDACHLVGLLDAPAQQINTAILDAGTPVADCAAVGGEPSGALVAVDPITVCCG